MLIERALFKSLTKLRISREKNESDMQIVLNFLSLKKPLDIGKNKKKYVLSILNFVQPVQEPNLYAFTMATSIIIENSKTDIPLHKHKSCLLPKDTCSQYLKLFWNKNLNSFCKLDH